MWDQLEPTPAHITILILSTFLIVYSLFAQVIRNHFHLSEPPLAILVGILFSPRIFDVLTPTAWGYTNITLQEVTRVIVGIQCFAVGIELPRRYFNRHWKSVLYLLGPVMTFSWAITALFAYLIFRTSIPSALIIGACLSPTDPILAASVLTNSRFSSRVPKRLRHLLSAESASNDGVSFPFLYFGLAFLKHNNVADALKGWFLITILYQCLLGIIVGFVLGILANHVLRICSKHGYASRAGFIVFYLLLALQSIGIGSTLGLDDFLVAFGAGVGFAHDGWFAKETKETHFPFIVDALLSSTMFVYFGAIIPWSAFVPKPITPHLGVGWLFLFFILVLLFRRIPIILALKRFIPDIRTYQEALFVGHFGPMGVGALFLAMEARAQLETGTSIPLPKPPVYEEPYSDKAKAIELVWPVVCFTVFGSTIVHGFSVAVISVTSHYSRKSHERAPLIGGETEGLHGMDHEESEGDVDSDESDNSR